MVAVITIIIVVVVVNNKSMALPHAPMLTKECPRWLPIRANEGPVRLVQRHAQMSFHYGEFFFIGFNDHEGREEKVALK